MTLLLAGVLLLPLVAGIILLMVTALTIVHPVSAKRTLVLCTAVATLCALLLLGYGEQEVHMQFTWLPGSGELSLHIGGAGFNAALTTMVALLAFIVLSGRHQTSQENRTPLVAAICLVALSAANAAFMAGHFLGRYVALEFVGLCVALAALLIGSVARTQRAWYVYLLLRLGDAGMLTAILLLFTHGGTLTIGDALLIGEHLPSNLLAWVTGGFMLTVAVKTGVWPFQSWVKAVVPGPTEAYDALLVRAWLYPVVMPNLGLYLLYRITPLLLISPAVRALTLMLAILALGVVVVRWRRHSLPIAGNTVFGALGLLFAATGMESLIVPLLIIATPLRLVLWGSYPLWRGQLAWQPLAVMQSPGMQDNLASAARSLQENVEHGLLESGLQYTMLNLRGGAHLLHHIVEHGLLEQGLRYAVRSLRGVAHLLHHIVEEEGLEGLLRALARGSLAASRAIQSYHTGQLRRNLGWVTLALLLAVVLLVSLGWR